MKISRSIILSLKTALLISIIIVIAGCPGKPPNIGQITGPSDGPINVVQTFYITATDPGNQEVQYHFDWGDGVTSAWTAPVASGSTASDTHTFTSAGEKQILAQAKNSSGKLSGWSSPKIFFATSGEEGVRRRFIEVNEDEDTANFVSTPAIGDDGTIYVGCSFGHFHAIDSNGISKTKFTHPEESEFISSPAIGPDGTIYVGVEDSLYAFNSNLGVVWRFPTGGEVISSPAIGADGTIYLHSDDGILYALSSQGTEQWRDTLFGGGYSSPAISPDGSIYVGGDNGYLFCILSDGSQKWSFYADSPIYSSPTIDQQGRIYFGTDDRGVFCIDSTDSLVWRYQAIDATTSPVIDNNGNVFVSTENGELVCINPDDGSERWVFSTGGALSSTPAVRQDGVIYFRTMFDDDDSIFAVNQDGSRSWAVSIGASENDDPIPSPTIANNGNVFIGGGNALYGLVGKPGGSVSSPWPMFRHDVKHTGRLQGFRFLTNRSLVEKARLGSSK
jgi:outer membrane protein assembly factor BamB